MATKKTQERLLNASALWQALDDADIAKYSYARKWLKRQEDEGHITYPKRGNHQEKRKFTATQIAEIVNAFRIGGPKKWKWPGGRSKRRKKSNS